MIENEFSSFFLLSFPFFLNIYSWESMRITNETDILHLLFPLYYNKIFLNYTPTIPFENVQHMEDILLQKQMQFPQQTYFQVTKVSKMVGMSNFKGFTVFK